MSYQLLELKLENTQRVIKDTAPLYLTLGALSSNDITTLKVAVVVGSISGGTAALTLETSMDGGLTWKTISTGTDGPITGAGTYQVWMIASSGISGPNIRLKLLPSTGISVYLTKAYRTFASGDVLVPRDSDFTITLDPGSLATAAKQDTTNTKLDTLAGYVDQIEGYVDGIETLLGTTNTNVAAVTTRLNEMGAGLVTAKHDSLHPTFNATSDVWVYKLAAATVATLTINYVDATKAVITSIVRT